MSSPETACTFCDVDTLLREKRVIRMTDRVLSIVSNPSFGDMHCLVLPREHTADDFAMGPRSRHELADETALLRRAVVNAYKERLALVGKTAEVSFVSFTKPEPSNPANGISVFGHLHNHVYPLQRPDMTDLVPAPRHPGDFHTIPSDTLIETRDAVRRHITMLSTS